MQNLTWQHRQRQPEHQAQWLFKMPFHLMELETLVETYPDALFIQTHREPTQFMGSWNSFVERTHSLIYEPQPRETFGAEQLALMSGMMDRAVHFRETHPELEHRWMDVKLRRSDREPDGNRDSQHLRAVRLAAWSKQLSTPWKTGRSGKHSNADRRSSTATT